MSNNGLFTIGSPSGHVQTSTSGYPTPISYQVGVALGLVPGFAEQRAVGTAFSVAASTPTDIWSGSSVASALYPFQTSAKSLEIVSSSASDTFTGGVGAISVMLTLLDANYNTSSQIVLMNGTTVVAIPGGPYLRCNGLVVNSAGTSLTNVGNITLRVASAGATQAYMPAGIGVANQAIFTVPNGYSFVAHAFYANIPGTGGGAAWADLGFYLHSNGSTAGLYQRFPYTCVASGISQVTLPQPIAIPQHVDMILRATNVSATMNLNSSFQGVLVQNSAISL